MPAQTNDSLNQRIAELCGLPKTETRYEFQYKSPSNDRLFYCGGWETSGDAKISADSLKAQGWVVTHVTPYEADAKLPDYCNDLNAVHEVESWLMSQVDITGWCKYVGNLARACETPGRVAFTVSEAFAFAIHATARQRCEALVATLS